MSFPSNYPQELRSAGGKASRAESKSPEAASPKKKVKFTEEDLAREAEDDDQKDADYSPDKVKQKNSISMPVSNHQIIFW